jgi:nucleoside-diphosphate-sugar epimerase
VVEAARREEPARIVHTSTSEVYGTAQTVPIDEEHPLHPQSPYAASKVGADQIALSFQRSVGTPVVVARPFNTYGPRQSARAVIPTIVTQALARDVVELGATDPTRDFLFVEDTVRGMMRCAEAEGVEGEVINLGTGIEISIGELAERVLASSGRSRRSRSTRIASGLQTARSSGWSPARRRRSACSAGNGGRPDEGPVRRSRLTGSRRLRRRFKVASASTTRRLLVGHSATAAM